MEEKKYYTFKVIFNFLDYKEKNKYSSIRCETIKKEIIKIDKETIEFNGILGEEYNFSGEYDEIIYLIPENNEFSEKKYNLTLNIDKDNKFNFNINEEGDFNIEIVAMWDVDYNAHDAKTSVKERIIPDIKYNGKIIKVYEKLYERKRWNILNAKIENIEEELFSEKTLSYIRNNKNKNYKYDILYREENTNTFLSEKKYEKIEFFNEKEKVNLKNKLEVLSSKLSEIINILNSKKILTKNDSDKSSLENLIISNKDDYINLVKSFKLCNKKWNLYDFSENDFNLFLLFSDIQVYYKENINLMYIKNVKKNYEELKKKVIANNSLNFLEKTRIICAFSKFASSKILKRNSFPELFLKEDLAQNDPYKISIEKFELVINGLKESSGYFKKLLLNDMGSTKIINLWDFEDIKITNSVYLKQDDMMYYFKSDLKEVQKEIDERNKKKVYKVEDIKDDNKNNNEISNEDNRKVNKKENETKDNKDDNENFKKGNNVNNNEDNIKYYDDKDKENKNHLELTFPVLSMLTLKQVKEHLFNLLPKFFFKVNNNYSFNALSDSGNRIILFNPNKIFNLEDVEENYELEAKQCVLPLMIELAHEPFSHLKIRYSKSLGDSPLLNPIKGNNRFLCPNDFSPESGYAMEYFMIDNYDEFRFLKFRNADLFPLTDEKYWTDINFNEMQKFNRKIMDKKPMIYGNFERDFEDFLFDKRNYNDDENIRCFFRK